ncbi:MAG: rRNA pseudouridine synthase [Treponema sp.]|nr:rRNA pseudouridine synthase [Treponema sp.]
MERIDKVLAHHGYGTRKDVKKLLRTACITLNGKQIFDPATHIDLGADTLAIDGEVLSLQHDLYLMMNKCKDVVCANKDGEHRTVFDLIAPELRHPFMGGELHHVGRLDIDTEGLLILTTDGSLTHKMISPKTHIPKTYAVRLRDSTDEKTRAQYKKAFAAGLHIPHEGNEPEFEAQSAELVWLADNSEEIDAVTAKNAAGCDCLLTIYEGKFHQVKRMFTAVGNEVVYLKRVAMGKLKLDSALPLGEYRELTEEELGALGVFA